MSSLRERSGLEALIKPGRHGRGTGAPGVTLRLFPPRALATVIARKGGLDAATAAIKARFGVDPPATPARTSNGSTAFIWSGPGHWLASSDVETPAAFEASLREAVGSAASVIDQSAGRSIVRLSGPDARAVLAKMLPLDLHASVFPVGGAASSLAGHIGVQLWLLDATPAFEIAVMRSYAPTLWRLLVDSSAEFGVDVV